MDGWVSWSFSLHVILFSLIHLLGCQSTTTTTTTTTMLNGTDQLALLAFKEGISKDPLHVLDSWNDSLHFCEWKGVTCSHKHHQRVTILNLTAHGIVGRLSPHIANLTFLRAIDLSSNSFNGEIPPEVGHLLKLRHLNLSYNSFGGNFPHNLSYCSELRFIHLHNNQITGNVPVELGSLPKLELLDLMLNDFTGSIPVSLANISTLTVLNMGGNNLVGLIPNELGRLWNLKSLLVGRNLLSGILPSSLYNLTSILNIVVGDNKVQGSLPPQLGLMLPNLQYFYIGENQFSGAIPVSLSNISGLKGLDISSNSFHGPVSLNFGRMKGLRMLNIGGNQLGSGGGNDDLAFLPSLINCSGLQLLSFGGNPVLHGVLPGSIANLSTHLRVLWLGVTQISGSIPTGIENLIGLTSFNVESSHFTGVIPTGIGKLINLQVILMGGNDFSGNIPSSLGNITRLNRLSLGQNNLHGSIPLSFGNFQDIESLYLDKNNLVGDIPKQILNLSSLSIDLDLSANSFTGSLPSEVGSLKNLANLDVSYNNLSGEIPSMLGNCRSLVTLHMEGNSFQGTIPPSLSNLGGLEAVDLSRNNLSGPVPNYLVNFPSLRYLNLSFNNLEGALPKDGIFKNSTAVSVRGNKNLCGGIQIFHLPKCPNQTSKKQGKHRHLKVIIPVVSVTLSVIILSCSFGILYWRRRSRKNSSSSTSFLEGQYLKISYGELIKATDGFSSANLTGVGGYGSVYKGVLDPDGSTIAVKVFNLQQRGALKSFLAECEALRKIRHRNLIKILTACSSLDFQGNDFKALVFEYMPNGSLEKWLHPEIHGLHQPRKLNLIERLNIAIDVASALEYLHYYGQTPIIHRDLKPSNILLCDDMTALVADFGLAKFLSRCSDNSHQGQTNSVVIKGSIGYVAPEYGLGGKVSTNGDVYSYGILLLEMFTGKPPIHDMFKDSCSLHEFAKLAMPERVLEIADPQLLLEDNEDEAFTHIQNSGAIRHRIQECLASVVQIGIVCSAESPKERMGMREVAKEMQTIRDIFLGVGIHGERKKGPITR